MNESAADRPYPIRIYVGTADALDGALSLTLRPAIDSAPPVRDRPASLAVTAGLPKEEVAAIRRALDRELAPARSRIATPIHLAGPRSAIASLVRDRWTDVPLGEAAERFASARLPLGLSRETWFLATSLPSAEERSIRPIAAVAELAHPRQRLAARLAASDPGAIAELGTAVRPSLVLLVGDLDGAPVVAAVTNVVAAELFWLAWRSLQGRDHPLVPWHDPVVQRASSLVQAPTTADQVEIALEGSGADREHRRLRSIANQLADALGISGPIADPHR